jgi:cytochrome c-type biogenesis protein CcmF
VFIPLMVPLLAVMAAGPMLSWKRGDATSVVRRLRFAFVIALLAGGLIWFAFRPGAALAALGMGLAVWLAVGTLSELAGRIHLFRVPLGESLRRLARQPRASWGMVLAHFGLAIAVAGMTASSAWKVESIQAMAPGDTVDVAGYHFTFQGARAVRGPNYGANRGTFTVTRGGRDVTVLYPEKRVYDVRRQPTTEAAIYPTFLGDLYAVIGDPATGADAAPGAYVTRLYFNPLVPWMWTGALIMVAGGLISLTDRRHRVGAPAIRRAPSPQPATQGA